MALYKLEDFYPNYQDELFGGDEIKGLSVYTEDGEKVGIISGALVDEEGHFRYLVMDTGFWIFGKSVLLPVGQVQSSPDQQCLYLKGLTKQEAKVLPTYDEETANELLYASFEERPVEAARISTVEVVSTTELGSYDEAEAVEPSTVYPPPSMNQPPSSAIAATNVDAERTVGDSTTSIPATAPTASVNGANMIDSKNESLSAPAAGSPSTDHTTVDRLPLHENFNQPLSSLDRARPIAPDVAASNSNVSTHEAPADGLIADTRSSDRSELAVDTPKQPDQQIIPAYEERLVADKHRQKAGEVTIGKRVETEMARVAVPVEKERVVIERNTSTSLGQEISLSSGDFETQVVARIELYEEAVEIRKRPTVREELRIRKEVLQETISTEESLRREELEIKTEGNPAIDWK